MIFFSDSSVFWKLKLILIVLTCEDPECALWPCMSRGADSRCGSKSSYITMSRLCVSGPQMQRRVIENGYALPGSRGAQLGLQAHYCEEKNRGSMVNLAWEYVFKFPPHHISSILAGGEGRRKFKKERKGSGMRLDVLNVGGKREGSGLVWIDCA